MDFVLSKSVINGIQTITFILFPFGRSLILGWVNQVIVGFQREFLTEIVFKVLLQRLILERVLVRIEFISPLYRVLHICRWFIMEFGEC